MDNFTSMQYIQIHIASVYGLDKKLFSERLLWVAANENNLENLVESAENPHLFARAVEGYRQAQATNATDLLVSMDATASGFQIIAALTGCMDTARSANLIADGIRHCPYKDMAEEFGCERDQAKEAGMPMAYGSVAEPEAVFGDAVKDFFAFCEEKFPGVMAYLEAAKDAWVPMEAFEWTTPTGYTVRIPQMEKAVIRAESKELGTSISYGINVVSPQESGIKLCAHIVHSLDAWVVEQVEAAVSAKGGVFLPVHDDFFVHPSLMGVVRQAYREAMATIAREDFLGKIISQILGTKMEVGKLSPPGELADEILNAEYILS